MSKKINPISTLEYYNYGENNKMDAAKGPSYKVKVSDKDGNIITIEKDDALYACVNLDFNNDTGVLRLLDVAHDNSVLAEIEMPNADYIYNCRYDKDLNSILFDVRSLYGDDVDTIELNVDDLVELYEAGQGIEIGEKNEITGRKPISIKLAEGEELLQLTDSGLGLDGKVITEEELDVAISGKADVEYVDELFSEISGITSGVTEILDRIEAIEDIIGTDIDDPNLDERIDSKADLDEFNDLEEEVGEIETNVNAISGDVETLKDELEEEKTRALSAETELRELIENESERALSAETALSDAIESEINDRKSNAFAGAEYDSSAKTINFTNANDEIIGSIDATDFVKDGMIDSVELVEISGDTYLKITWNTDAGKEITYINIGDVFNADNYYTKDEVDEKVTALQEMDAALANVDSQQWAVINQNRVDMETVDRQLWAAIGNEAATREAADNEIRNSITGFQSDLQVEAETRENADNELRSLIVPESVIDEKISHITDGIDDKIEAEKNRAISAETALGERIVGEKERAEAAERDLQAAINEEADNRASADTAIRQELSTAIRGVDARISEFETGLDAERTARTTRDNELQSEIDDLNSALNNYATKEYVDGEIETVFNNAVNSAKTYTDEEIDKLEAELIHYCDSGHTELQQAISNNTTRINAITEWDGQGVYDDSDKNGILDVLHREFHEYERTHGTIKSIEFVDGNLIITYDTPEGEKQEIIPISELIVLDDYYTKEDTDALLDEKLDVSAYTDISEQVSANTENISILDNALAALIEKLGYKDNESLVTNGEHEVAFGEYNVSNTSEDASGQTIFSIGNGTDDDNRSNAVEVRKNGDVYLWVEGEFMNINKLLGQIAHEVYDADTTHNSHFFDGD